MNKFAYTIIKQQSSSWMRKKTIIWLSLAGLLSIAATVAAIRYLKPNAENKQKVQRQNTFPVSPTKELTLVYMPMEAFI